jgi:hypothetical protein
MWFVRHRSCVNSLVHLPMLESIFNTVKAEWAVLSTAPWSFALTFIVAFGAAFGACRWAYKSLLDTAKERLESLKERLEGKDDQLGEYRERLHLMPASGSQYSKLTHKELQDRVIKFVEGVRTWFAQSEAENRGIADQQWHAMVHAQTKEQKQQLWQAHTGTLTNGLFTLMRDFDQKFKVDAILLRDELLSRLPATEKSVQANRRYEHPVNTFCINEIADDLERKAKLLR